MERTLKDDFELLIEYEKDLDTNIFLLQYQRKLVRIKLEIYKRDREQYIEALGNECAYTDSWLDQINEIEDYLKEVER